MKVMIVLALLGIFAASNGGNDTTVEAPSYDSVVYADYFEENPEAAANYYPEAYATYLEEKDAVEAMNELYAQSEQNTCDTYYYESTGVDENAWSDTNETAPMPENEFSNEDILGYWMDYSDAEQPRIMYFYEEKGQLMHRYYTIVAGNPAKPLRKRFDDELIELLIQFKWWDRSIEEINTLIPILTCSDLEKVRIVLKKNLDC